LETRKWSLHNAWWSGAIPNWKGGKLPELETLIDEPKRRKPIYEQPAMTAEQSFASLFKMAKKHNPELERGKMN